MKADPWYDAMSKEEMERFLKEPLIMRLAVIDSDNYPLVHPVWYIYRDGELFVLSNKESKKVKIIRNNKKVYFTIDIDKPTGVRGKGDAMLIEDQKLALSLMKEMIIRYIGNLESEVSKMLLNEASESVVIKIKPRFFATWIYR